jgi:hypothetical protein
MTKIMMLVGESLPSTAARMQTTGGPRILGVRAVGVLRADRQGAGVSGSCPGPHEGRAPVAREEHARADPGLLRDVGRTRVSQGSPEGRGDDTTSEVVCRSCAGGACHREEAREGHPGGGGVLGRGHEGHAGRGPGDARARRPGNTGVQPGRVPRSRAGGRFECRGHPGQEVQARITTEVRPRPGGNRPSTRAEPGWGACKAEPRQNQSIIRV